MKLRRPSTIELATIALMAAFALMALNASPSHAERGWKRLGRTQADFGRDHDVIVIRGPSDNFRALKLKVTDAPLELRRLQVTYDNNTVERLEVRSHIPKGGESRPIDLRGGQRSLKRVEFWYETKGMGRGRADVTLFGRR